MIKELGCVVVHNIVGFLSKDDAVSLAQTSRAMRNLVCDFKIRQYSTFWEKIAQGIEKYFIDIASFDKKKALEAIPSEVDWGNDVKTIGKRGKEITKVFLESVGYPKEWNDLMGKVCFSIVHRLFPYPFLERNDLFANHEMEESRAEGKFFMVPLERQSSLCLAQLFHFIYKNPKDCSSIERSLLEAQERRVWGESECAIAGALCARLIEFADRTRFKEFFELINPSYQERVVINTARAFTMIYDVGGYPFPRFSDGDIDRTSFGLFGILMRCIAFEKMSAKTQLALVKMLIIADCGEALSALEKMPEGVEKNVAKVEMVYYFYQVISLDSRLPIEQRKNFANLMIEIQNIPEDIVQKRVSKGLVKYLTLIAHQTWEEISFLAPETHEIIRHRPLWGDEEITRSYMLMMLGLEVVRLFTYRVTLPVDEEILDFLNECKMFYNDSIQYTESAFIQLFTYLREEKNAIKALDSTFSLFRETYRDELWRYHSNLQMLAISLSHCSPAIQNSTVFLLKIADLLEVSDPHELKEAKKDAIKPFIKFSYRRVQGEEAFLRLIRLVKKEEEVELYPLFVERLKEFSENKEVMHELLSFLSCGNRKNLLEKFTPHWSFLLREGFLKKEEVLGYIREMESDAEREKALAELLNSRTLFIEEGIFSAEELDLLRDEFIELQLSRGYRNGARSDGKSADAFAESFFAD